MDQRSSGHGIAQPLVDGIRILLDHGYLLYRLEDEVAYLRRPANASMAATFDVPYLMWQARKPDRYVRVWLVGDTTDADFASDPIWPGSGHP